MSNEHRQTPATNDVAERKRYSSPRLTRFGAVRELTTGGSFGNREQHSSQLHKARP